MAFYKRRAVRLLPAYSIVAVCYYALLKKSVVEIIYNTFFLNFILEGKRDFWYIFASIIVYLFFPLYGKLAKRVNFRWTAACFVLTSIAVTLFINYISPKYYELWEILLWRLPCFWIGCYFGDLFTQNREQEFKTVVLGASALGICLILFYGLISAPGAILRNEFTLLSPAVMMILVILLKKTDELLPLINRGLSLFGTISLELYVIHVSIGLLIAQIAEMTFKSVGAKCGAFFLGSIILSVFLHRFVKFWRDTALLHF